jgi:cytidine deaminase
MNKNPQPQDVKQIFSAVYIFYTRWIAVKANEMDKVIAEAREISDKYPCELCRKMLAEVIAVLQGYLMGSSKDD